MCLKAIIIYAVCTYQNTCSSITNCMIINLKQRNIIKIVNLFIMSNKH